MTCPLCSRKPQLLTNACGNPDHPGEPLVRDAGDNWFTFMCAVVLVVLCW